VGFTENAISQLESFTDLEAAQAWLRDAWGNPVFHKPHSPDAKAARAAIEKTLAVTQSGFEGGARIERRDGGFALLDKKGKVVSPLVFGDVHQAIAAKIAMDARADEFAAMPAGARATMDPLASEAAVFEPVAAEASGAAPDAGLAALEADINRGRAESGAGGSVKVGRVTLKDARIAAFIDGFEKAFGRKVVFYRAAEVTTDGNVSSQFVASPEEARNGFVGEDADTIYINAVSDAPTNAILGHEFSHSLKASSPELWERMSEMVMKLAPVSEKYRAAKQGQKYDTDKKIMDEWVSDVLGQSFDDPRFWRKLAEVSERRGRGADFRSMARAILDWLGAFVGDKPKGSG
jgi:hypothetical protein